MKWNLEEIFKNKEEFENEKKNLLENLDKIERNTSEKFDLIQAITYVLEKYYGEKIAHNVVNNFVIAISKIYYEKNKEELEELIEKSGKLKEKRKAVVDTKHFLNEISTEKKQNLKKLDKIEKTLKDRKLLEEEFINRNEKGETYFSINTLINILEREKEDILVRNDEIDDLRNPEKYANETRKIEEEIQFIEEVQNTNFEKEINEIVNILVKIFEIKLKKAENKKEIIKLIYEFRYFILLEYNKNNKNKIPDFYISGILHQLFIFFKIMFNTYFATFISQII